ncbi:hypothetical protein E2C01_044971 [Portunus trituberculatus]|uniref:Uncharacterized protein n=1 Tax=Portunus trituberculatus TaxID=210409 RepID=A0A5B7FUH0_PORTR|nr:hypothetical protein [Portunus trituberculatus]
MSDFCVVERSGIQIVAHRLAPLHVNFSIVSMRASPVRTSLPQRRQAHTHMHPGTHQLKIRYVQFSAHWLERIPYSVRGFLRGCDAVSSV